MIQLILWLFTENFRTACVSIDGNWILYSTCVPEVFVRSTRWKNKSTPCDSSKQS